MSWQTVAKLSEIDDVEIFPAEVDGVKIIVLRFEGDVVAYLDACPHEGVPLSCGERTGGVLVCFKHLWEFDVGTGEHVSRVRRLDRDLTKVPVRVVGDKVEVDVSNLVGKASAV